MAFTEFHKPNRLAELELTVDAQRSLIDDLKARNAALAGINRRVIAIALDAVAALQIVVGRMNTCDHSERPPAPHAEGPQPNERPAT